MWLVCKKNNSEFFQVEQISFFDFPQAIRVICRFMNPSSLILILLHPSAIERIKVLPENCTKEYNFIYTNFEWITLFYDNFFCR